LKHLKPTCLASSAVGYLGPISADWTFKKLKYVAEYSVSNVDKVPSETEVPVRLCNYVDVYNNEFVTPSLQFMESTATSDEIRRFSLKSDDVLITKDSESWRDIAVPALVQGKIENVVCGYHLAIIRAKKSYVSGRFLFRYLQSGEINQHFQVAATGVTRFGLPKDEIGSLVIGIPPWLEQEHICALLDHKTAQIDTLLRKKEELIDKLREKRAALISRTVTRGLPPEAAKAAGLNPHPKMKDSGIAWLQEIPEHWDVRPLGYVASLHGGATPDKGKPEYWDGDIPWVSPKDMKRSQICDAEDHISRDALLYSPLQILPLGSILIVVRGMILAHSFPVAVSLAPLTINQDMKAIVTDRKLQNEFLFWVLTGAAKIIVSLTDESAHGTRKLETSVLKHFPIVVPPPSEQTAIADYLRKETEKADQLIEKIKVAIEKLAEYRCALITAAVTGKIDVRNYTQK
jgi:type I restriction enzyme S subunit